jgi:hypothetical protein
VLPSGRVRLKWNQACGLIQSTLVNTIVLSRLRLVSTTEPIA